MIHLCLFEENPSTGSKDILFFRIWPWKWCQGHQTFNISKTCAMTYLCKSEFKKYIIFSKNLTFASWLLTLVMGSRSPKYSKLFRLSQVCKIGVCRWTDGWFAILHPFQQYFYHMTMGGWQWKAVCNGTPFKVEKISPQVWMKLGPLDQ